MNITQAIEKFDRGDSFTDQELLKFYEDLSEMTAVLHKNGGMFSLLHDQILYFETRVFDILVTRNIAY